MDPRKIGFGLLLGFGLNVVLGFCSPQTDTVAERVKKVGTAILAYSADFDGAFPLQSPKIDGKWAANKIVRKSTLTGAEASVWPITLLPYLVEGAAALKIEAPTFTIKDGEYSSAMSFNGLLHAVKVSQVAKQDLVPLVWTPFGKQNVSAVITSPLLSCYTSLPCDYFSLRQSPSGAAVVPNNLELPEGEALYSINVDLSLKRPAPKGGDWKGAVYSNTPGGGTWMCVGQDENGFTTGGRSHPCYFRPDRSE